MSIRLTSFRGALTLALGVGATSAMAQVVANPDLSSFIAPQPSSQISPFAAPSREPTGLPVSDWLLYPALFVGGSYDSNVFQVNSHGPGDSAFRAVPSIAAVRNAGIHSTAIYGTGDFTVYKTYGALDLVNGKAGFLHKWEAQRDLVFTFNGAFARQVDTTTAGSVLNGSYLNPVFYETYKASASVLKSFDRVFVGLGGSFLNSTYENTQTRAGATISQASRDFNTYALSGRLGYYVTPLLYSFVEGVGSWYDYYNGSKYNSEGYKFTGGLGTDRISLFKGEVYAGYQQQFYANSAFGAPAAPAFGAKVYWYPTQFLTVTGNVDESLGTATFVSPSNPNGSATKTTGGGISADYHMFVDWSAVARVTYSHAIYVNNSRVDDTWGAGATLSYRIWRNFSATVDYQLSSVDSNYASASYLRQIASVGLLYKY